MLAWVKVLKKVWLIGVLPTLLPRVLRAIFAAREKEYLNPQNN